MIVHEHDSGAEPAPKRGEGFGRRFAPAITRAVGRYRDWFAASEVPAEEIGRITAACRAALEDWAPNLLDESDAIARGAGLPPDDVFMLTCRTEIVAAAPRSQPGRPTECSTLVAASSALTVVAGGEVASIELCPAGTRVVRPGADGWLARSNHFLDPTLTPGDLATPAETTWARHRFLTEATGRLSPLLATGSVPRPGLADVAAALVEDRGDQAPICLLGNPVLPTHRRSHTLLTVLFDGPTGRVDYVAGHPADAANGPVLRAPSPRG